MLIEKINQMNSYPGPISVVDTLKSNGFLNDKRKNPYDYGGHITGSAFHNTRMSNTFKCFFGS